jgi:protein dithiol oxidoreductase (disulfide-forming)
MKAAVLSLACAACFILCIPRQVQCEPRLNAEYTLVAAPNLEGRDGTDRVVEFFWYGCTYCREFQPVFSSWASRNAGRITVDYEPVALRGNLIPGAKTYYALKEMGLESRFHEALLEASVAGDVDITLEASIKTWLVARGVDSKEFEQVYESQRVARSVQDSMAQTVALGLTSIPSLVVNGKYLTSTDRAKGYSNTLEVLDYLLAKADSSAASPEPRTREERPEGFPARSGTGCSACETGNQAVIPAPHSRISPLQLRDILQRKDFFLVNVHGPYEGEIDRMADEAARELATLGYTGVDVLDGGMTAWIKAGFPIKKSRP